MARACLEFHGVTFIYDSAAEAVFEGLSALLPPGWTGVIGPNGAGKTTLLRLASGLLRPQRGQVRVPGPVVCCPQRTDDPPDHLAAMLAALDPEACALRGQLGLEDDWLARWATLSHGERKRAQIGVALWRRPAVLAVDEPTNHIDADARALLLRAMRGFDGVGLLVSHDRELLDGLCAQCLFLEPPSATLRPGGYTKAVALAAAEQEHLRHAREQARRDLRRLEREASSRRAEAAGADRKRSKRHLARGDSDGREKLDRARVTGKDGQAGRILRQMEGRVEQAQDRLAQVRVRKQRRLGLELRGEVSPRNVLAHLPAGRIPLGERRALEHPELRVTPADRIAVVGPNGSGKSTLIGRLVGTLDLPPERLVYMAQELDRGHARELLTEARGLPPERLGEVLSAVDSLGSDPKRLLATDEPSPGEVRKLLLALGLARRPHLLVLDEPTNHLDLPSIECLERALSDCPAALVLVSHDHRFLRALARDCWVLSPDAGGARLETRPGAP